MQKCRHLVFSISAKAIFCIYCWSWIFKLMRFQNIIGIETVTVAIPYCFMQL